MNPILLLDYAGVAVFAATGALAASRKQLDIIGFLFLAAVTGTGGGTLRDVLLGHLPVFWVANPAYMLVCAAIGVIVFFTAHLVESRYRLLLWLDAVGLAAYRAIIPEAVRLLAPGGALIVEAGHGQSGPITDLMAASGLTSERPPKADLAGIPRAVAGRRPPR